MKLMSNAPITSDLLSNIIISDVDVTADVRGCSLWISLSNEIEAECYWTIDGEIQGLESRPELIKAMRMARLRARMAVNLAARAAC